MTRIPEANVRIGVVSDTHNHLRNVRRIDPHAVGVLDLSSLEAEWLRF